MSELHERLVSFDSDQRLSQLIKLKRLERPDPQFWTAFEQEFRSKQLSSLVRVQPLHTRLRLACMLAARKAAPPTAAVSAVAVTLIAVTNTSYLANNRSDAEPNAPAHEDALTPAKEPARFMVDASAASSSESEEPRPLFETSAQAIYQMNVLMKDETVSGSYQLLATPVTFSSSNGSLATDTEAPEHGAAIIRTRSQF